MNPTLNATRPTRHRARRATTAMMALVVCSATACGSIFNSPSASAAKKTSTKKTTRKPAKKAVTAKLPTACELLALNDFIAAGIATDGLGVGTVADDQAESEGGSGCTFEEPGGYVTVRREKAGHKPEDVFFATTVRPLPGLPSGNQLFVKDDDFGHSRGFVLRKGSVVVSATAGLKFWDENQAVTLAKVVYSRLP